jgi:hypothetical protein
MTALYVAVHWVAMGMWTLVPIDDFARVADHIEIGLETAFKAQPHVLPAQPPRTRLGPTTRVPNAMEEAQHEASANESDLEAGDEEEARQVSLVVINVRLFAGGKDMLDEREKALVWFLTQHARWPCEEDLRDAGDGMWEMVFTMAPDEVHEEQGFSIIGWLRELYTRMFYSRHHLSRGRHHEAQHRP